MTDRWILRMPAGGRLEFKPGVMEQMTGHAQTKRASLEAGGILVGRRVLDSDDVVVDAATEPMPNDRRGRLHFHRLSYGHQEFLDEAWGRSKGVADYLGEWHTHASADARPSTSDLANWRLLTRSSGKPLVFVIVGAHEVGCWCGGKRCEMSEGDA